MPLRRQPKRTFTPVTLQCPECLHVLNAMVRLVAPVGAAPVERTTPEKRSFSPEALANIRAALDRRWANYRKTKAAESQEKERRKEAYRQSRGPGDSGVSTGDNQGSTGNSQ